MSQRVLVRQWPRGQRPPGPQPQAGLSASHGGGEGYRHGVASVLGVPAAVVGTEAVREDGMQMGPQGGGEREEEARRGQLAQGQGVPCDWHDLGHHLRS